MLDRLIDWPVLRQTLFQRVYFRHCRSNRFAALLQHLMVECVGPHLVVARPQSSSVARDTPALASSTSSESKSAFPFLPHDAFLDSIDSYTSLMASSVLSGRLHDTSVHKSNNVYADVFLQGLCVFSSTADMAWPDVPSLASCGLAEDHAAFDEALWSHLHFTSLSDKAPIDAYLSMSSTSLSSTKENENEEEEKEDFASSSSSSFGVHVTALMEHLLRLVPAPLIVLESQSHLQTRENNAREHPPPTATPTTLTPLRQVLSHLITAFGVAREAIVIKLQETIHLVNDTSRHHRAQYQQLQQQEHEVAIQALLRNEWPSSWPTILPLRDPVIMGTHGRSRNVSLSMLLQSWQRHKEMLKSWWNETHENAYWAPSVLGVPMTAALPSVSFFTAFLNMSTTTAKVNYETLHDHVTPSSLCAGTFYRAEVEDIARKDNAVLLTGLSVFNAVLVEIDGEGGGLAPSPGEIVSVKMHVHAITENEEPSNHWMEVPIVCERMHGTEVLAMVRVHVTPVVHAWATCPYVVVALPST